MSLAVDVDLTKFDKIIAEGYDSSGGPIKFEFPKPTFNIPAPTPYPKGAYVTSATISSISITDGSGLTYAGMTYAGSFDDSWPKSGVKATKQFTFDDFTRALHEVVAERPSYTYPKNKQAVYRDEHGRSACLIGVVLDRLDPAMLNSLPGLNGSADMVIGFALEPWFAPGDLRRIAYAARKAQIIQDSHLPWDHAEAEFHRADRMAFA
jgi:hypothetical protein